MCETCCSTTSTVHKAEDLDEVSPSQGKFLRIYRRSIMGMYRAVRDHLQGLRKAVLYGVETQVVRRLVPDISQISNPLIDFIPQTGLDKALYDLRFPETVVPVGKAVAWNGWDKVKNTIVDWNDINVAGDRRIGRHTMKIYGESMGVAGQIARIATPFDVVNENAVKYAAVSTNHLVTVISDETKATLRKIIESGVQNGDSAYTIGRNIRPYVGLNRQQSEWLNSYLAKLGKANVRGQVLVKKVDKWVAKQIRYRAEMIARTETARAMSEGTIRGYKEGGLKKIQFEASGDACIECFYLDGNVYTLSGGSGLIPVHPNCRCTWLPLYEEISGEVAEPVKPKPRLGPKPKTPAGGIPKPLPRTSKPAKVPMGGLADDVVELVDDLAYQMEGGRVIPPVNAPPAAADYKAYADKRWADYKKVGGDYPASMSAKDVKALKELYALEAREGLADGFDDYLIHRRKVQRGWAKKNGGKLVPYEGPPVIGTPPVAVKPTVTPKPKPPKPAAPKKPKLLDLDDPPSFDEFKSYADHRWDEFKASEWYKKEEWSAKSIKDYKDDLANVANKTWTKYGKDGVKEFASGPVKPNARFTEWLETRRKAQHARAGAKVPTPKPKPVAPKPKPVPEPKIVLPKTPDLPTAPPVRAPTGPPKFAEMQPEDIGKRLVYEKDLGGSTGARLYKDVETGERWVVKHGASEAHARNELLSNKLYDLVGVNAPESHAALVDDQFAIVTRWVDGKEMRTLANLGKAGRKRMQQGFASDSWLANWDVLGASGDNIIIARGNVPWRIDNGGALLRRARGEAKRLTGTVGELTSLKDPARNRMAAELFGDLSADDVYKQALKLRRAATDRDLARAVDRVYRGSTMPLKEQRELIQLLKDRRDDLFDKARAARAAARNAANPVPLKPQELRFVTERSRNMPPSVERWKPKKLGPIDSRVPDMPARWADDVASQFKEPANRVGASIEQLTKELKMSEKEVMEHLQQMVEQQMKKSKAFIRAPITTRRGTPGFNPAEAILKDGRFKTQFETGTSSGALDNTFRKRFERDGFGVRNSTPLPERPIYGYLSDGPGDALDGAAGMDHYGQVAFRLKDKVKTRATWTGADSLGNDAFVASPVN